MFIEQKRKKIKPMEMHLKLLSRMALVCVMFLTSCEDENDNNLLQQEHDKNEMMDLLHVMQNEMDTMQMTGDPDIDFAMMMRSHHQGAIRMAQKEKDIGTDGTLKSIAQNIITTQSEEVQTLTEYLAIHSPDNIDSTFMMESEKMMEEMGRQADLQVISGNLDQDFASLMIVHHQYASTMAQHYLLHGTDLELKEMAEMIKEMQPDEVKELQNWLLPYIRQ